MNQWVRLPVELLQDDALTATALHVAAVLIDRDTGNHKIQIGLSDLQNATGASRRSVQRAIALLRQRGIIIDTESTGRKPTYTIREILPPKRRGKKAAETDVSAYEVMVNRF